MKALPLDDLIAIWNAFNGAFLTYTRGEDAHAEFIKELKQACGFLREMCEYIGGSDDLLYTIDQVGHWADLNRDRESLFALAVNALNAVTHMLARPQFKIIPSEKLIFFEVPRKTFGEGIIAKFHGIEIDVEEAGKCYAAGRDTACVFHLMRVMEVGLRALAASLNDPKLDPKRNPSWDSILGKCGDELEKSVRDRSPEWRQDDVFYSTATANLRAVKDAWRNPTMHVEQNYNEETALDIWNAVRAFMRHLSLKLTA